MKRLFISMLVVFLFTLGYAQNYIQITNPEAENILFGNYDPENYSPSIIINHPDSILQGIVKNVSSDNMISYLEHVDSFYNRNSGSDTLSETQGIGAARTWMYNIFKEISADNENRLVVTYMTFVRDICGQDFHKNVLGVLPGLDTTNKEILIVEGHFDTRCEGVCDTSCYSPGMDDNGSGTVLVMELARIMSRYSFNQTVVFTLTTGEDQGLFGAKAFANYLYQYGLVAKAVLNNDVVGGIACGNTSSPPSCPYMDHIDSTHVRIFSHSMWDDSAAVSPSKQLARYIKLHQDERINPLLDTPMEINIIISEDRVGRSGDHIPFRQRGYPAIRFCSQNEHGNGTGTPPDRQHTTNDVLGLDTSVPPDGIIDSFFVDRGYLRRNTISNGVNLGWLAISPPTPDPVYDLIPHGVKITIQGNDTIYQHYRVGVRSNGSGSLYFDTVYTFLNTTDLIVDDLTDGKEYYISVMNVENGVESLLTDEETLIISGIEGIHNKRNGIRLIQNQPNPVKEYTEFVIEANENLSGKKAYIVIMDMLGREIERLDFFITPGVMKIKFVNSSSLTGIHTYTLEMNGKAIQTKKIVFKS